ncbi:hypothetical protein, partial [Pseudomonas aeruginosa]|uniref:hypothetical protein n=1 Tax=Pseudomonas aeruginosa TaxID=287 RepID=UPI0031B6AA0C
PVRGTASSGSLYFSLRVTEIPLALLRVNGRLQTTYRGHASAAQGLEISKSPAISLHPAS